MSLGHDLPLRCRCGRVRGVATGMAPSAGFRVLCYCTDCQAFAGLLGRLDVLDAGGGTDIFQLPPRRLALTTGRDAVRCVRFGARGVHRWYAGCCRTPIGNTGGPRVPLIGVIHCFMGHGADGRSRDAVLGPPLCRIFARSARGPLPPGPAGPPSLAILGRRAAKMLGWWVRGLARPHPFFDAAGAPCAVPRILTASERAAL